MIRLGSASIPPSSGKGANVPDLTKDQVDEAIRQLHSHAGMLHEGYTQGVREYSMLSAREGLITLGYHGEDTEQVLKALFDRGFTYCLDPDYHRSPSNDPGRIDYSVCTWGADQLESRLAGCL
jgi:hypothetical protein